MTPLKSMPRRILVVDDEPMVCDSIKRALALDGHEVVSATNGEEALGAVQAGRFDLIILDYELPGMNGDKVAAAIKALVPQQRILLVTAYTESLRLSGVFPLAVDGAISKPFGLEELREAVRNTVTKPQPPT